MRKSFFVLCASHPWDSTSPDATDTDDATFSSSTTIFVAPMISTAVILEFGWKGSKKYQRAGSGTASSTGQKTVHATSKKCEHEHNLGARTIYIPPTPDSHTGCITSAACTSIARCKTVQRIHGPFAKFESPGAQTLEVVTSRSQKHPIVTVRDDRAWPLRAVVH